jgi:hypothetical protein
VHEHTLLDDTSSAAFVFLCLVNCERFSTGSTDCLAGSTAFALRFVATPLSWENDSVRPVALRPRLSASLPLARLDVRQPLPISQGFKSVSGDM